MYNTCDMKSISRSGILSFYETSLGIPYSLPKLASISVPSKGGAMENWGLITYCEYCLLVDQDQAAEADKSAMIDVNAHEIGEEGTMIS